MKHINEDTFSIKEYMTENWAYMLEMKWILQLFCFKLFYMVPSNIMYLNPAIEDFPSLKWNIM